MIGNRSLETDQSIDISFFQMNRLSINNFLITFSIPMLIIFGMIGLVWGEPAPVLIGHSCENEAEDGKRLAVGLLATDKDENGGG